MRITINEFIKVFCKKSLVLIFLGLALLNAALLYVDHHMQQNAGISPSAYKALYEDVLKLPAETALETVQKRERELWAIWDLTFMSHMTDEEIVASYGDVDLESLRQELATGDYLKYTESIWTERALYSQIISEMESCATYDDYLQKIDDDAKTLTSVSIFADPDTFSYRNIMQTPAAFAHLKGNVLTYSPSNGVKMATEFLPTDIIAVLMILVVVVSMITREKELSQIGLVKSTYKGRETLIRSKFAVVCIGSAIIQTVLYGTNFVMAYFTYGFGDLSRYIQSVYGYIGSNLEISVGQYFVLFLLAKLAVYLLLAAIIFYIANRFRNAVQVYLVLAAVFGISGILYYFIQPSSYLSLFKYINPVSFLYTHALFNDYLNINLFGFPINYLPIFITAVLIGMIGFAAAGMSSFCRQKTIAAGKSFVFVKRFFSRISFPKTYCTTNVFLHECYKIFIGGKVLLILLVFAAVVVYTYQPMKEIFYQAEDVYYKQYMLQLEGEVTSEKLQFLAEEQQVLFESPGDLTAISKQKALDLVSAHTVYLQEKGGWYLYDSGYQLLTGKETQGSTSDLQLALIAAAILIASLSYVYSVEHQNGAVVLLRSSYKGRKPTFLSKLTISVGIATIVYLLTYGPYFYNVLSTYGVYALNAPACSIEHLANVPAGITILGYLILISVMRYIGLLAGMAVIFALSVKLKSYILTLLASSGVLVLPVVLSMLNIHFFDYVLFNPLLIGNVFQ